MDIVGIEQITYGSADLATCERFFQDWGLRMVRQDEVQLAFETLNGARVVVADPQRVELPPAFEDGPTLREVTWGVADAQTLERLRAALRGQPGHVDTGDVVGCTDPNGMAVRFRRSRTRAVDARGTPTNTWDRHPRVDQPATIYERADPIAIGHVVFFVADLAATEAFYASIGFLPSDRYPGRGVFMRCTGEGAHHQLFLLSGPDGRRGLNHVNFSVRDIHEVFGGGLHFSRCGWETQLGPGRHPISSAYFWYFRNPAGGLIEYSADEDHLTPAWQPREFTPGPTVFAEWAVDGGIDGHTRRQKHARADGRFLTERRD